MRITRFVNGIKVNKPFSTETVIKSDVISSTIDRVNRRLKTDSKMVSASAEENR
jgi:hypothetical protein